MNEHEQANVGRRLRFRFGEVEDALDRAVISVERIRDLSALDPTWHQEFRSDIEVIRDKLQRLSNLIDYRS